MFDVFFKIILIFSANCCKMVRYCCVPQCRTIDKLTNEHSFHVFPKNRALKRQWIHRLRIGKKVTSTMVVCNKHFLETDYSASSRGNCFDSRILVMCSLII